MTLHCRQSAVPVNPSMNMSKIKMVKRTVLDTSVYENFFPLLTRKYPGTPCGMPTAWNWQMQLNVWSLVQNKRQAGKNTSPQRYLTWIRALLSHFCAMYTVRPLFRGTCLSSNKMMNVISFEVSRLNKRMPVLRRQVDLHQKFLGTEVLMYECTYATLPLLVDKRGY